MRRPRCALLTLLNADLMSMKESTGHPLVVPLLLGSVHQGCDCINAGSPLPASELALVDSF